MDYAWNSKLWLERPQLFDLKFDKKTELLRLWGQDAFLFNENFSSHSYFLVAHVLSELVHRGSFALKQPFFVTVFLLLHFTKHCLWDPLSDV